MSSNSINIHGFKPKDEEEYQKDKDFILGKNNPHQEFLTESIANVYDPMKETA